MKEIIKGKLIFREVKNNDLSVFLRTNKPTPNEKTGKLLLIHSLGVKVPKKPKTKEEKEYKNRLLLQCEELKNQRIKDLNNSEIMSSEQKKQLEQQIKAKESFNDFFEKIISEKEGKTYLTWLAAFQHFEEFSEKNITFEMVDEKLIRDFVEYIKNLKSKKDINNPLSNNTMVLYLDKFKTVLNRAYEEKLINADYNKIVKFPKNQHVEKVFLTFDEVKRLIKAPCNKKELKKAALFSVYTGLRKSDLQNLKWNQIIKVKDSYKLFFTQQKTKKENVVPIGNEAFNLLGEPSENGNEYVFKGLATMNINCQVLKPWLKAAGIDKKISFHSFRHTFAVLQLEQGTELYTVSKMLGHKSITSTEVYAQITDKKKTEAANALSFI